jgi:hypothetical protein
MTVTTALSDDAADKLHAVLRRDWPEYDKRFPRRYVIACDRWFAALANDQKFIAMAAADWYHGNDETGARKIAEVLPRAPKFSAVRGTGG